MPIFSNKEDMFGYQYYNVHGKVFAIDCQGKYGILGGQKAIYLVNLDNCADEQNLISLRNDSKIVQDALWSPQDPNALIVAASEIIELWERKADGKFCMKSSFHGHTRPICNIDWSPVCQNFVATCSSDCFTYVLDVRDFKKASLTLQSTLPPSLAKWNKVNEMVLATAHEGGIEIWDLRNVRQARPSTLITAHPRMINDFDWSPSIDNQIVTCSMDSTLKVWNVRKPKEDRESGLTLNRIVLRVKYTPFGNAIVTQCMAQGSENDLYLWRLKNKSTLENIHLFQNSSGMTCCDFRKTTKDPQLVGWSNNGMLKFWKIDPSLRKLCDPSDSQIMSMKGDASNHPQTLMQEFELLSDSMSCIEIEKKNASERMLRACARMKKEIVRLEMRFPPTYPNSAPPEFKFLEETSLDVKFMNKLLEELKSTASACVQNNRCCVESCLRILISFLGDVAKQESDHVSEVQEFSKERLSGENVPFPRTSGARFCGPGFLVCFTRRMWMEVDDYSSPGFEDDEPSRKKTASEGVEVTPRAMSALAEIEVGPRRPPNVFNLAKSFPTDVHIPSISLFFEIKDQEPRVKRSRSSKSKASPKKTLGPVIVYDLSCLSPIQKQLGENYVFDDSPFEMCEKNAQVALACARKDLYQVWSLLAHQVAETSLKHGPNRMFLTPFGKNLIKTWYDHYSRLKDVQTLAMICCVLSHHKQLMKKESDEALFKELIFSQKPSIPSLDKGRRKHSNSFSESYDVTRYLTPSSPVPQNKSDDITTALECMLDNRSNSFIKVYSNILFQWGFVNKRAELLNFLSFTGDNCKGSGVVGAKMNDVCSICHMPVRGPYVFCFECYHGGHVTHLSDWFSKHDVCPTGCGCVCLIEVAACI